MCTTRSLALFCQHMVEDVSAQHGFRALRTLHSQHGCEIVASVLITGLTALLCVEDWVFYKPPHPECYTESPKHVFQVLGETKVIWYNDKWSKAHQVQNILCFERLRCRIAERVQSGFLPGMCLCISIRR